MNQDEIQKALETIKNSGVTVAGDLVLEKNVDYEVSFVEKGGIGIQINNGNSSVADTTDYPKDQQMADALLSINGKGKMLDEYQKWLGVCCYVSARCGYPMDLDACCRQLANLPYREPLEFVPQYKSIRVYGAYNFVKAGFENWKHYKVNDQERNLFIKCYDTAIALENALNMTRTK